jgi:hypothetical protein
VISPRDSVAKSRRPASACAGGALSGEDIQRVGAAADGASDLIAAISCVDASIASGAPAGCSFTMMP